MQVHGLSNYVWIVGDLQPYRVDRKSEGFGLVIFPDGGELLYDEGLLKFGDGLWLLQRIILGIPCVQLPGSNWIGRLRFRVGIAFSWYTRTRG